MPPEMIHIRPPTFERRFIAAETDDADTLVGLASDESYFVRRQAVQNPNTPRWILYLLVRAGATADLRGRGDQDPDLDSDSLRRLAETGPWARQLVVEHPNTSAEVLAALKDQPAIPMRLAIAAHPHADEATLAILCCDIEGDIRAQALANPNCPPETVQLLNTAGASPDIQNTTREFGELTVQQFKQLAEYGAWGRFLTARHPDCPIDLLAAVASDTEWQVRSGLFDNPGTPESFIRALLDAPTIGDVETIQCLSQPQIPTEELAKLARHPSPVVRMSLARHPAATAEILGRLATDGVKEIRRLAANHSKTKSADLDRLVRAGSTPDLMGMIEPDPAMTPEEIHTLLDGGAWACQLAVRHPNTNAETLAHLLCDRDPKIREWAAVHPNLSPETKRNLLRAGSGSDFQGFMPPDPELAPEVLYQISRLGTWGEWVVANNPNSPADLLEWLAQSEDLKVQDFVAHNPSTPATVLARLSKDARGEVQEAILQGRG